MAAVLWIFLFNPGLGLITHFLNGLGYNWNHAQNSGQAMFLVVLASVWQQISYNFLFFLAALQSIPRSLVEAAAIDGATAWHRFWKITWPLLLPVTMVVTLFSVIQTFSDFQLIYVLTGGGPANSTHLIATYAYQVGVATGLLGEGAAISLFMLPVLFVVLLVPAGVQLMHLSG